LKTSFYSGTHDYNTTFPDYKLAEKRDGSTFLYRPVFYQKFKKFTRIDEGAGGHKHPEQPSEIIRHDGIVIKRGVATPILLKLERCLVFFRYLPPIIKISLSLREHEFFKLHVKSSCRKHSVQPGP